MKTVVLSLTLLVAALPAFGQIPQMHVGDTAEQVASENGVNMDACRKLNFSSWDVVSKSRKLHVDAEMCKALMAAEQGAAIQMGRDGEWEATFVGGKVTTFNDGHFDATRLTSASQMPAVPGNAYDLKGDTVGMSMAEYIQQHANDCVTSTLNPKPSQYSPTKPEDPNSFHLTCVNYGAVGAPLTLATYGMRWETVEFSKQRLYRLEYVFSHDVAAVIEDSLTLKFGEPTTVNDEDLQNGFGAHFKRETMIWKNGTSTVTFHEMIGSDLTISSVEVSLDEVYNAVQQREGKKFANAAKKDM